MTLNEFTTLLAEPYKRQFDMPFKLMLAERIKAWRARLIHDTCRKSPSEVKYFLQTIYIPITEQPLEICGVTVDGCNEFRSEKIPDGVRGISGLAAYVGSVDGKTPFRESAPGSFHYAKHGILQVPTYSQSDNRILLDRFVPVIRMDNAFSDPLKAITFSCNADGTASVCNPWDEQYPVSGDVEQMIIQAITQELRTRPNEQEVIEAKPEER
jgi:hypothetical protein